jgi:uncharacterized membrane protein YphA (DoxX/SURF4 family)
MTSLPNLLISFAITGMILTAWTVWKKKSNSTFWSFLQHFCGVWFVFSGLVKAVDPIGTAYKMIDYFGAFEVTFAGLDNFMSGLAPMFPWLSKYAESFSIIMIVLEIAVGVMLMVGYTRKLTAWLFFLIVFFFTILTGFTFLTGYVPTDANFFDFAKWGPYVKEHMRVTDCGCFGDFIKLDPRISFYKDLGLMVPAILFIWRSRNKHQLWTASTRNMIVGAATALSLLLCVRNTYWDLPMVDFRPFKVGTDVRAQKELESSAKIDILGWVLEDTINHVKIKFMEPEPGKITYYKQYPAAQGWKVREQIKTDFYILKDSVKVPITKSKISDFAVESADNGEVTEDILQEKNYSLMIVAYHLEGDKQRETFTVQDTTWAVDTIAVTADSSRLAPRVVSVQPRQVERMVFVPTPEYAAMFQEKVNPVAEAAQKAGWKVYCITTFGDSEVSADFAKKVGANYDFYRADDKLLKTIIRANPGLVIWKDGKVLDMYHHRHLPTPDAVLGKWK